MRYTRRRWRRSQPRGYPGWPRPWPTMIRSRTSTSSTGILVCSLRSSTITEPGSSTTRQTCADRFSRKNWSSGAWIRTRLATGQLSITQLTFLKLVLVLVFVDAPLVTIGVSGFWNSAGSVIGFWSRYRFSVLRNIARYRLSISVIAKH